MAIGKRAANRQGSQVRAGSIAPGGGPSAASPLAGSGSWIRRPFSPLRSASPPPLRSGAGGRLVDPRRSDLRSGAPAPAPGPGLPIPCAGCAGFQAGYAGQNPGPAFSQTMMPQRTATARRITAARISAPRKFGISISRPGRSAKTPGEKPGNHDTACNNTFPPSSVAPYFFVNLAPSCRARGFTIS